MIFIIVNFNITVRLTFNDLLVLMVRLFFLYVLASLICHNTLFAQTIKIESRKNSLDSIWIKYPVQSVETLNSFSFKKDPSLDKFGGWKTKKYQSTGFFRIQKIDGRWWIIDPEGYPFIHRGVVAFTPGISDRQQEAFNLKFNDDKDWVTKESYMLRSYGFNGVGAWSDIENIRNMDNPLVYTIIVSPMGSYKSEHIKKYGGKYQTAGWQGYRYDLVMVFDPDFEKHVEKTIAPLKKYKDDKFLLGYFTDNELPWVDDALDRHLKYLAKDEPGYIAAQEWLDNRKGFHASLQDITPEDRLAFCGFYFETYMKKVTNVLRKVDPNHMYLGCRFNQEKFQELLNPEIFRIAGKYMDIISINHYRKWEPLQWQMDRWGEWSGKPFLITEWYVKGEDTELPNRTGAGWNVRTQNDRGLFYENFTLRLLKNRNCVGWHWFRYQDNDPENLKTDPSNRDSNKGVIDSEYNIYKPLMEHAKNVNNRIYRLIEYFDKNKK